MVGIEVTRKRANEEAKGPASTDSVLITGLSPLVSGVSNFQRVIKPVVRRKCAKSKQVSSHVIEAVTSRSRPKDQG